MRSVAFEGKDGVDHVFDDAGSGDLAVLGDMADKQQRGSARFGEADKRLRGPANLAHRSRRRFDGVAPHRLNQIDDDKSRRVARAQGRHDVFNEGLRGELHGRVGEPETCGAKPHLRGRLLSRDVNHAPSGARDRGAGLNQKGGLADSRLAADQRRRPRHKAAAGHPVEFCDSGGDPQFGSRCARQVLERKRPAARRRDAPPLPDPKRRRFLDDRIPFAARSHCPASAG